MNEIFELRQQKELDAFVADPVGSMPFNQWLKQQMIE
jgi:hypothetical protein